MPPNFKKYFQKLEESAKDPFLYLGFVAVILFLILSFSTNLAKPSLNRQGFFASLSENFSDNPFVGPMKNIARELPDFLFVQNSSLRAVSPPVTISPQVLGMWLGEGETAERREITEYLVEEGDSLWLIAERFSISLDTMLWANDLKSLLIQPGQKLLILPVSGIIHLVKEGDTISGLAERYKADTEKILAFNDLAGEKDLIIDEVLIIPDGRLPSISIVQPAETFTGYSTSNFYGQSHNYPWGQCTWWVAQKRPTPAWGNANQWLDNAIRSGFPVCKGSWCIPQIGKPDLIALSNDWLALPQAGVGLF